MTEPNLDGPLESPDEPLDPDDLDNAVEARADYRAMVREGN